MLIEGNAHKFGDNLNTDDIIPAKYLVSIDPRELASHCMEHIAPGFCKRVKRGDIVVGGKNFGCGSSREHAPLALKGCGVSAVICESFAGIFFRNAINIGLPFLELKQARRIKDRDRLRIDLSAGLIENLTQGKVYHTEPFPRFLQEIIEKGGLLNYIRKGRR